MIQASSTASPAPQSSSSTQKKSHAGAIAGGVVVGIAGAALLTAFILWYLRRRRQRAEARPSPFAGKEEAFGMPEPDTSMAMGKYYVRPTSCWHSLFSTSIARLLRRGLCDLLSGGLKVHVSAERRSKNGSLDVR